MNCKLGQLRAVVIARILIGAIVCIFCLGCSGSMALRRDAASIDTTNESIAAFTLIISNVQNPDLDTSIASILIKTADGKDVRWYTLDPATRAPSNGEKEYLVSVALPPGDYQIGSICGAGQAGLIKADLQYELNAQFTLPPNSVTYLGNVELTNRPRKPAETPSGNTLPLIDPTGFHEATIDASISDRSDQDLADLRRSFPCLKDRQFSKAIMVRTN